LTKVASCNGPEVCDLYSLIAAAQATTCALFFCLPTADSLSERLLNEGRRKCCFFTVSCIHSLNKAKMDYEDEEYDQYQQYEDEIYKDSSERRYSQVHLSFPFFFFFFFFLFFADA